MPSEVPLALFQSERYDTSSSPEMQWNFPVSNGNYEVRLYFAENYSGTGSPGQRVFDVALEDVQSHSTITMSLPMQERCLSA